jgi:hypothetical protein
MSSRSSSASLSLEGQGDLIQSIGSAMSIGLTYDAINSVYGLPQPDSDLDSNYESAALLLDAALWNVGQVAVRNLDGTFTGMGTDTSDEIIASNLALGQQLAGGDMFGSTGTAFPGVAPQNIIVTFPKWVKGTGYLSTNASHFRSPINGDEVYTVTVALSSLPDYSAFVGYPGTMAFHDAAKAVYDTANDADPSNATDLTALATQLATDFYDYLSEGLDITFAKLVP